jgi:hypothetical protein
MTGKAEVRKRRPGSVDRRDAGDAAAFALDLLLIFEQFVEALLQEKEELESKEDEAEDEAEGEGLMECVAVRERDTVLGAEGVAVMVPSPDPLALGDRVDVQVSL